MSKAAVPGSFDPMTLGHRDVVEQALDIFGSVTVIVANNVKKSYAFTPEQRVEIARAVCDGLSGVEVRYCDGIVVDLARDIGASVLVKGIRNGEDLEYEMMIKRYNDSACPEVKTVFVGANDEYAELSSTKARLALEKGEDIEKYVGETAARLILSLRNK